jgi:pimeloyl-ACP methyl ester carboxylesterase
MNSVTRKGLTIRFTDLGSGSADPMLLVHGWGGDHSFLAAQQQYFGRTRRCFSVDLRGHGRSMNDGYDYSVRQFGEDLIWLCSELQIVAPIVVGHSMGGVIALDRAASHQGFPRAIAMIDSMVFPTEEMRSALSAMAANLSGNDYLEGLEAARSVMFLPTDDPAVVAKAPGALTRTPCDVLVAAFKAHLLDYDARSAASTCQVPVAYIGAEQPLGDIDTFKSLCPHLKVGKTIGAGHFSPLLVPDQINAILDGFIRKYVDVPPPEARDNVS